MARHRKPRQSQGVPATTTELLLSFDDDFSEDEDQNTNPGVNSEAMEVNDESNNENGSANESGINNGNENNPTDENDEGKQLKSNVWFYAKKVSSEKAQCRKCKISIKTVHGGTTTLRKHLVTKHNLTHLALRSSPRNKPEHSISRERKARLDHLANLAIFEDGRTFGDLRRSGIRKFLAEAAPDDESEEEDDEEDNDLITDAWSENVITGDAQSADDGEDENEDSDSVTKENVAETVQKGRSLIKTIRRSQILNMFIDNEKQTIKVTRRLIVDCMSRWNSTYLSLKSLLEHKQILVNLFDNKRKLPLTSKQKEKLNSLELTSDDWLIFVNLMDVFEPFYQATNLLSGSKYPTIGLCLFAIRNIKDFLESEDDHQSRILADLKKIVLEAFNQYFDENNEQYFLFKFYGYFDPLGYSVLSTSERTKIERQIKQKQKEQSKSQVSISASSTSMSSSTDNRNTVERSSTNVKQNSEKPSRLNLFLRSVDKTVPSDKTNPKTISEEISLYKSLCQKNPTLDAITFWKTYGAQMPLLKAMAQRYLSTPGTSVPSESAFSSSAYIARKERARLSGENLSYTVFLQDKLRSQVQ